MKSYKFIIPLVFVVAMLFPMALFAQEATPEAGSPISIVQALQIVQAQYGTDMVITEISFYSDEDDDDAVQTACWHFEFADGTELCVDAYTGTIVVDDLEAEETPEAEETEDFNDDEDSNDDDSSDDSSDDDDVNDDDGEDTVTLTPAISLEEAIALALSIYPNSIVTNVDLEVLDDGTLVWDIELDNDVRSVDINATTGEVLGFGYEEDDDNGYYDDDSNDDVNDDDDSNDDDSNDDDSNDDDSNDDDSSDDDDSNDDDDDSNDDDDDSNDDDDDSEDD